MWALNKLRKVSILKPFQKINSDFDMARIILFDYIEPICLNFTSIDCLQEYDSIVKWNSVLCCVDGN